MSIARALSKTCGLATGSLSLALLLTACGGSGSSTPTGTSVLQGTYHAVGLAMPNSGAREGLVGTANANGADTRVEWSIVNRNDSQQSGFGVDVPFRELGNSEFEALSPDSSVVTYRGGHTPSGATVVASTVLGGTSPGVALFAKTGTGFSDTSVQGDFHFGLFIGSLSANTSAWGTLAFDGMGGSSATTLGMNDNGTISGASPAQASTYSVSDNGAIRLDTLGAVGALFGDGGLLVFGGPNLNAMAPGWLAAVPAGTGLSAATFSGEYWVVGIAGNPSNANRTSIVGTATADGIDRLSYTGVTENNGGSIGPRPDTSNSYTVAGDGIVSTPAGQGGVSPDGRFAFLSGESITDGRPMLYLFVKK